MRSRADRSFIPRLVLSFSATFISEPIVDSYRAENSGGVIECKTRDRGKGRILILFAISLVRMIVGANCVCNGRKTCPSFKQLE